MCPLVIKVMVGCWFMRYCCFGENYSFIYYFIGMEAISYLWDPRCCLILISCDSPCGRTLFGRNRYISEIVHLAGVRRSHCLYRGSSLVMCGLSYTFSWRSVF